MRWTVRILEAQDSRGATVYDVVATNNEPVPWENPDHVVGSYPDRLKAMVAGRLFAKQHGLAVQEAKVVPFPVQGRAM